MIDLPRRIVAVVERNLPLIVNQSGRANVTSKAEEYRTKARECADKAKTADDPDVRKMLKELERQWLHMAEQAERRSL